jgi:hypothetical protein
MFKKFCHSKSWSGFGSRSDPYSATGWILIRISAKYLDLDGFREYRYEKLVEVKLTRNCVQNVLFEPVHGAAGVADTDPVGVECDNCVYRMYSMNL